MDMMLGEPLSSEPKLTHLEVQQTKCGVVEVPTVIRAVLYHRRPVQPVATADGSQVPCCCLQRQSPCSFELSKTCLAHMDESAQWCTQAGTWKTHRAHHALDLLALCQQELETGQHSSHGCTQQLCCPTSTS